MTATIRNYIDQTFNAGMTNHRVTNHVFDSLAQMRGLCLETYDAEGVAYCESRIKELIAHVKANAAIA